MGPFLEDQHHQSAGMLGLFEKNVQQAQKLEMVSTPKIRKNVIVEFMAAFDALQNVQTAGFESMSKKC